MQYVVNSDIRRASVPKEIEDNAMTKDMTGVLGGSEKTQKGSSLPRGTRNGDPSSLGHHGLSSLLTLKKFCGALVPKRESSENSNLKMV